jgi:NAD(P)-dependent dehydrogenase (short-subunit alcohol dehydrogenase family)
MTTAWTDNDLPNQDGKLFVITGANSGLGFESTLALAKKGARVVMACRTPSKAEAALAQVMTAAPRAQVEIMPLDLASLASITAFAQAFAKKYDRLDVLLNNAGLMAIPLARTQDGFEMQLGTNHLGHFALSSALWPTLVKTPGARVVNVASLAHKVGKIVPDDLNWTTRPYDTWAAYGQSKLANLLFTLELHKRTQAKQVPMKTFAAHPGYSATGLQSKGAELGGSKVMDALMSFGNSVIAQSAQAGAWPQLRAATDPDATPGGFYGPSGLGELRGKAVLRHATGRALDGAMAETLWQKSVALTHQDFGGL